MKMSLFMYFLYCVSVRLQVQLAALQEQSEEEQRSSQREAMRLRDQLQQEREEAHTLRDQLHVSHCSQVLQICCDS